MFSRGISDWWAGTKELFRAVYVHRTLIHEFVIASERSSYYRLSLGLLWRYLEPMITIVVYYFFLVILRDPSSGTDIVMVILTGLMIYSLFDRVVNSSLGAIPQHENILLVSPTPVIVFVALNFYHSVYAVFPFWVLGCIYFVFKGVGPTWTWLGIIPIVFMLLACLWPLAIILSIIGVYIRDLSRFISVMTRMLLFVSPVLYELKQATGILHTLLTHNPLTPLIEGFRDSVYRNTWPAISDFQFLILLSVLLMILATYLAVRTGRHVVKVL